MVDEEPIENNMDEGADDYRRLNRKCMLSMYINYAAVYAILLVSYFVVMKLSKEHLGPDYDMVRYIAIAALAIVLTYMIAAPPVYYARYKYMITKDKIDVPKLVSMLNKMKYIYPYHQAIGFYMENAGYKDCDLNLLREINIIYDFYLTYAMTEKSYSKKWKIFYPKDFCSLEAE